MYRYIFIYFLKKRMSVNCHHLCLDMFCSVSIHQCISGFLEMDGGGTYVSDHHGLTVPSQGLLKEPRQFAVPVIHVLGSLCIRCETKKIVCNKIISCVSGRPGICQYPTSIPRDLFFLIYSVSCLWDFNTLHSSVLIQSDTTLTKQ